MKLHRYEVSVRWTGAAGVGTRSYQSYGRDHIISLIDPENTASIRVAERLGETLEGEAVVNGYKLRVYGIRSPA